MKRFTKILNNTSVLYEINATVTVVNISTYVDMYVYHKLLLYLSNNSAALRTLKSKSVTTF